MVLHQMSPRFKLFASGRSILRYALRQSKLNSLCQSGFELFANRLRDRIATHECLLFGFGSPAAPNH
jgi:hypothetical protein